MDYLVTTDRARIPTDHPIIMVDGTVPGWSPGPQDLHFDHHRPDGGLTQIEEIGWDWHFSLRPDTFFVTTQVDADACAAAAWILLCSSPMEPAEAYDAYIKLWAIACDCDHLGLPPNPRYDHLRDFAAKAVAALKEDGSSIAMELGLPSDRRDWSESQREIYASECFRRGVERLVRAAQGRAPWPGERGEAEAYFSRMAAMRGQVAANCRIYRGVAVFDQRSIAGYVDPRLLVEWAREEKAPLPYTLTIRDGTRLPNAANVGGNTTLYSYTLGSIPLHPAGCSAYSERGVWAVLAECERKVRAEKGIPAPETTWGGRDAVGGSGWRDPAIATPEQVIDCLLEEVPPF